MSKEKLHKQDREQKNNSGHDRRNFLRSASVAGSMVAMGAGLFSVIGPESAQATPRLRLASVNLKKYLVTPTQDGKEVEMEIEHLAGDGKSDVARFFGRWAYSGDTYNIFGHVSASRFQPESTFTVSGKKGHVEADYRHDSMSMVIISSDGTIHRLQESDAKVPVKELYPGVSEKERVSQYLRNKSGQTLWQTLASL